MKIYSFSVFEIKTFETSELSAGLGTEIGLNCVSDRVEYLLPNSKKDINNKSLPTQAETGLCWPKMSNFGQI